MTTSADAPAGQGCGAYTGEMAVDQMADMGLKCCLIGHSERRGEFGLPTPKETDELLATKCAYILEKGLMCVYCIGEPLPIREKGLDALMKESIIPQLTVLIPILKALEDKTRARSCPRACPPMARLRVAKPSTRTPHCSLGRWSSRTSPCGPLAPA